MVSRDHKIDNFPNFLLLPSFFFFFFFFFWIIIRSGLLTDITWSVCISKSHWSLCVLFSMIDSGLCIYQLFVWSNLYFLHISQWITLPTQLCLVLFFLCANLLHLLMMWSIVSSLSPHSLHLLFCCVFDKIGSYGVVLSYYLERFCFSLLLLLFIYFFFFFYSFECFSHQR